MYTPAQSMLIKELVNGVQEQNAKMIRSSVNVFSGLYGILLIFLIVTLISVFRDLSNSLRASIYSLSLLPLQAIMKNGRLKEFIGRQIFY